MAPSDCTSVTSAALIAARVPMTSVIAAAW
jgi:hypothetical protein